jgi:hypothetical protein
MVIDQDRKEAPCDQLIKSVEFGAFGLLAPQVVGKSESQLNDLCDRLEGFKESRKSVA